MAHVCKRLFISVMIVSVVMGLKQKIIPNLRQFSITGWRGEFEVNEVVFENDIRHSIMTDTVCGQDVFRDLCCSFSNILIIFESPVDHAFQEELPDRLKQRIASSFRQFAVMINITYNTYIEVVRFTDSKKLVLNPFTTNYDTMDYIDRIEDDGEGHVILFNGEDFMTIEMDNDPKCDKRESVKQKEESKYIQRQQHKTTNYPLPFDWGCDLLGDEVGFCKDLRKSNYELQKVGGDVCSLIQSSYISICQANMRITNMTRYFRDAVPFLAPFEFPIESVNAQGYECDSTGGLVFPCLI